MPKAHIGARGGVVTRRRVLRRVAAGVVLAGTEAITGFPTVRPQDIKDVTLVHVGGSYFAIKGCGEQAGKDLGFKTASRVFDSPRGRHSAPEHDGAA
jgi:putative spermidine/putrescine transport system substrate-binding protein